MDSNQISSFIPKTPVRGSSAPRTVRKVYLLTYLTFIVFLGALLAAGSTFIYSIVTARQLTSEQTALATEQSHFNQSDLVYVSQLDVRLQAAYGLLNRHVSMATLFNALEQTVLRSVQLTSMKYSNVDGTNQLTMQVDGTATDFNAVMFQRQVLQSSPLLADATLSKVTIGSSDSGGSGSASSKATATNNSVSFTLTKTITPQTFASSTQATTASVSASSVPVVPSATTTPSAIPVTATTTMTTSSATPATTTATTKSVTH